MFSKHILTMNILIVIYQFENKLIVKSPKEREWIGG